MNKEAKICDESNNSICNNRREFLVKASVIASSVFLGLSDVRAVDARQDDATAGIQSISAAATAEETVLKLDEKSPLSKVGGFETIETKAGKVVVVRTADLSFKAYSAVCPHKGGPIAYDEKTEQLYCPWHNSRFDTTGKVVSGPAKTPLKTFSAQNEIVIALDANG